MSHPNATAESDFRPSDSRGKNMGTKRSLGALCGVGTACGWGLKDSTVKTLLVFGGVPLKIDPPSNNNGSGRVGASPIGR